MSSTNKTEIGLNLWLGGDKPKREDFCNDNLIIDKQIINHKNDMSCHVSEEERNKWNTNVYCNIYYGNNESVRDIATACPFNPSAVIIFPSGVTPHVWDAANGKGYIYTAYGSTFGSTNGLLLRDDRKTLRVYQNLKGVMNEVACLNESGIAYCYVCIRQALTLKQKAVEDYSFIAFCLVC